MKRVFTLACLFVTTPLLAGVSGDLRQGGKLYSQGKYGQALSKFEHALSEDPTNPQAQFGAGAAAYYLKDYPAASQAFENAAQDPGAISQDALFNLGNTYYRSGETDKATAAYKQAILKNPQDKEAIHNLQLLLQNKQNQNN